MLVLIPHKDTMNLLCTAAKKILAEYNSRSPLTVLPLFPLWAFLDGELENPDIMIVRGYEPKDGRLVFPVEVREEKKTVFTEIAFGQLNKTKDVQKIPVPEIERQFPVSLRVFRTGNAEFKDNGWKLYDEKWHKCRK